MNQHSHTLHLDECQMSCYNYNEYHDISDQQVMNINI